MWYGLFLMQAVSNTSTPQECPSSRAMRPIPVSTSQCTPGDPWLISLRAYGSNTSWHMAKPSLLNPTKSIMLKPQLCRWLRDFKQSIRGISYPQITGGIINSHRPLARFVKSRVAHAPVMPGTFSPPPRVSDSDMHQGTCMTHVPWCMPESLTSGFLLSRCRGKRSRHSRRMRNPQFCVSGKRSIDRYVRCWFPTIPRERYQVSAVHKIKNTCMVTVVYKLEHLNLGLSTITDMPWRLSAHCWLHCIFGHIQHF